MLPAHLKRYVVEQDYSRYTPVDQEVWRYIMRQLKDFLSRHAHPCYVEGLTKTGIEIDRIPEISRISEKLQKFGWNAVPVSGFIPPAAFMEIQAHGYLPIASDMRTIDHLQYTPAPDIVHEAAGHAPILINEEFAAYLKSYAQVARKALISSQDMDQYEAIRTLSDLKEAPDSTPEQISDAELNLERVTSTISAPSEAAVLGRMNWWTAEYGLFGSLDNPKLYGAGLLSSLGEARACLDPRVKKIPFSLDCINYSYDITEQQPQLFVTPNFETLTSMLNQLASTMAFRLGGLAGLEKARASHTVNTVVLNSGLQISGKIKSIYVDGIEPAYLQFEGPSQLGARDRELQGHGPAYHREGFGSPLGLLEGAAKCLSEMDDRDLAGLGIRAGATVELKFRTGARVRGEVIGVTWSKARRPLLISFRNCTVTREGALLFDPAWGTFDMAVGSKVVSVFGGPIDRLSYGESDDFIAKVIPRRQWPQRTLDKHRVYYDLRTLREDIAGGRAEGAGAKLDHLLGVLERDFPNEWLLKLSLYELTHLVQGVPWASKLEKELHGLGGSDPVLRAQIEDGLRLA